MSIYVGNLSFEATEQDLQALFQEFGKVTSVAIIKDKFTGKSRGFGFVEMSSNAETQAAITGLNGKEFKGRPLTVNEARPRDDSRNRGQGGGGRPYGGGGGGGYSSNRGGFGGDRGYGGGHGGHGGGGRDFGGRKKTGGRDSNDRKWNKDRDRKRQGRDWDSGRDY